MKTALIGFTGFVGGNLVKQFDFSHTYNSKNIQEIENEEFDLVVCAGIQAKKWWANQNEQKDLDNINNLLDSLKLIKAERFVFVSTVDVYPVPFNVDEDTSLEGIDNHVYGRNRLYAETQIKKMFKKVHIVRLPGLFGDGLKKNVIYDLLNDNYLHVMNPACSFQYYYLGCLWDDINKIVKADLNLVNIATEPIKTQVIIDKFFPDKKVGQEMGPEIHYDMHSKYASILGGEGIYIYSKNDVLADIDNFIKSYQK